MLEYIQRVCKPYTDTYRKPKLFLLDMFSVHLTQEVFDAFHAWGTKIEILPAGCTSSCQPVDNGINKPAKDFNRKLSNAYKQSTFNEFGEIRCPDRSKVAEWIELSLYSISICSVYFVRINNQIRLNFIYSCNSTRVRRSTGITPTSSSVEGILWSLFDILECSISPCATKYSAWLSGMLA